MKTVTGCVLVLILLAAGCDETPTAPQPTTFAASVDRASIARNETATLTFRYTNTTSASQTLTFPSSCFVGLSFTHTGTGAVTPAPIACLTVITTRTLAPGEVLTSTFRVGGAEVTDSAVIRLASGRYRATGVFLSGGESATVEFTIT